jgi:hypothetical protein
MNGEQSSFITFHIATFGDQLLLLAPLARERYYSSGDFASADALS